MTEIRDISAMVADLKRHRSVFAAHIDSESLNRLDAEIRVILPPLVSCEEKKRRHYLTFGRGRGFEEFLKFPDGAKIEFEPKNNYYLVITQNAAYTFSLMIPDKKKKRRILS